LVFQNSASLMAGVAELVRTRQIAPADLVEEAIRRIEAHNPKLNAVICKLYDQARTTAKSDLPDGPFKVCRSAKDMHATVKGVPTSCGTRMLKTSPAARQRIVRRYRAAGVILLARPTSPNLA